MVYKEDYPAFIHSNKFRENIGKVDSDDFQMWIKRNLFIEIDSKFAPGKKCKGYIVDQDFFLNLTKLSNPRAEASIDKAIYDSYTSRFKAEIAGKTTWNYVVADNGRKHNDVILAPRKVKASLFKNYLNYDISSAAPTILYQLYHKLRSKLGDSFQDKKLDTIKYYIDNKEQVRAEIAAKYDLDVNVVKKIINGLFNKAPFSAWDKTTIFRKYLGSNSVKMRLMQKDDFIRNLRIDIRRMWRLVNSVLNDEVVSQRGKKKKNWFYYMREESKIRDVIEDELQKITGKKDVFYFLEHDGFRVHKKYSLDVDKLIERIKNELGYELKIEVDD